MEYTIQLGSGGSAAPCIYLVDSPNEHTSSGVSRGERTSTVVRLLDANWDDNLTPWPAKKVFKRAQGDFGGKADDFLNALAERDIPAIEREHDLAPAARGLAGYSLAGLFAVYALTKTDRFDAVASVSGSLWYDGLLSYLERAPVLNEHAFAYLSLGSEEHLTKNKRMSVVGDRTLAAADALRAKGVAVEYEQTEGTHFQNIDEKINRALDALERSLLSR